PNRRARGPSLFGAGHTTPPPTPARQSTRRDSERSEVAAEHGGREVPGRVDRALLVARPARHPLQQRQRLTHPREQPPPAPSAHLRQLLGPTDQPRDLAHPLVILLPGVVGHA